MIKDKYNRYRSIAKDGDIVLVRNPKLLGKLISFCDKASLTHVFIVKWETIAEERRLILVQEGFEGANIGFVSNMIGLYSEMIILRPKRRETVVAEALNFIINVAEKGKHYAYKGGLAGLCERFLKNYCFGLNIKLSWGKEDEQMCSQFGQAYVAESNINDFLGIRRMFPYDFIRFYKEENFELIKP